MLNTFYGLGVADSVISWVLKIPALAVLTHFAVDGYGLVHGNPAVVPPIK